MKLNSFRLFLVSTVSAVILATPALALDGQDLLTKINSAYKMQGIEFSVKSVVVDGDDVTLTETSLIYDGITDSKMPLGDVSLENVKETNGSYTIGAINFQDIDFKEGKTRFIATDIAMENVYIPALANANSLDGMLFYQDASASDIEFYDGDNRVLAIDSIYATMNHDKTTGVVGARFEVEDFTVDLTDLNDANANEMLNKMQIELLSGDFSVGGSWNTKNGDLDIEEIKLDIDNIGTLTAKFSIAGYTMEFVQNLQEAAKEQAGNTDDPDAASTAGLTLLGMAQELGFKSALIQFKDASITKRAIDYMAQEQGVSAPEFTTMIKAVVPMYVSQMGIPALEKSIVAAVNTFIDNPQTIAIEAKPKATVSAPDILGTALGNPADLVDVLGVTIDANK